MLWNPAEPLIARPVRAAARLRRPQAGREPRAQAGETERFSAIRAKRGFSSPPRLTQSAEPPLSSHLLWKACDSGRYSADSNRPRDPTSLPLSPFKYNEITPYRHYNALLQNEHNHKRITLINSLDYMIVIITILLSPSLSVSISRSLCLSPNLSATIEVPALDRKLLWHERLPCFRMRMVSHALVEPVHHYATPRGLAWALFVHCSRRANTSATVSHQANPVCRFVLFACDVQRVGNKEEDKHVFAANQHYSAPPSTHALRWSAEKADTMIHCTPKWAKTNTLLRNTLE